MREFKYEKGSGSSSRGQKNSFENLKDDLYGINPDDILKNFAILLEEIAYATGTSVDNKHEHLELLKAACDNIGSLVHCIPIIMKNNRKGAILANPELLLLLPNIDVKMVASHMAVLSEAIKMYTGISDDLVPNGTIAKQMFSLVGQLVAPHESTDVLSRVGKQFARTINDKLHLHDRMRKEDEAKTGDNTESTI